MRDDDFLAYLLARWDSTASKDRTKIWRELLGEISTSFKGNPGKAAFLGKFIGSAHFDDDEERRQLLAVARRSMQEDDVDDELEEIDDEDRPVDQKDIKEKRRDAKAEREAVLEEFNSRYTVVRDGGTALVFDDCYDEVLKRQYYDRLKPAAMQLLYQTRKVCVRVDEDGKRHYQPAAKWWLNHPDRRTFVNGTVFVPGKEARGGFLNLWRGYGFKPRPGCCEKFKAHIKDIICGGNPMYFEYLIGWMARAIQMPRVPGEVAVVLRGETRIGKGTFGHALRRLFGQHALHISSSKHLVGNFNMHLRDCVLLFADEAFFAADKPNISTLKALITESVLTIEGKYVNAVQCPNMLHVLMASNDDWVVPAAIGEERFFVLDVPSTRKGDHKYFAEIDAELEAGGYEAMLHELLDYDISRFNVRSVPQTEGLVDQKQFSLNTTFAWFREVIERGYVYESKLGLEETFQEWIDPVALPLLYASYRAYAKDRGDRHPLYQGGLEKFLKDKLKLSFSRPAAVNTLVGERLKGKEPLPYRSQTRVQCCQIGTLAGARKAFEHATGLKIDAPIDDNAVPEVDNVVPIQPSPVVPPPPRPGSIDDYYADWPGRLEDDWR